MSPPRMPHRKDPWADIAKAIDQLECDAPPIRALDQLAKLHDTTLSIPALKRLANLTPHRGLGELVIILLRAYETWHRSKVRALVEVYKAAWGPIEDALPPVLMPPDVVGGRLAVARALHDDAEALLKSFVAYWRKLQGVSRAPKYQPNRLRISTIAKRSKELSERTLRRWCESGEISCAVTWDDIWMIDVNELLKEYPDYRPSADTIK
jgi:hypothetical protein